MRVTNIEYVKILIAPDKFKDSLTADEVCQALYEGLMNFDDKLDIVLCPMADGGDGSISVVKNYIDLVEKTMIINDPLMRPISASYYYHEDIAYIEMARASGLTLLDRGERNPMITTSYGTGQLLFDAVKSGYKRILLFLGGSATHDLGIGLLAALGYRFMDIDNNELIPIGENLNSIYSIDDRHMNIDIGSVNIELVTDVISPLLGDKGASFQFAKQKGSSELDLDYLEEGAIIASRVMNDFRVINNNSPIDVASPGAGAAGGVGYGCMALLNARISSGTDYFTLLSDLESKIEVSDLIITGEGKIDDSSIEGKVISGICRLASEYKKPIFGICGILEGNKYTNLNMENVITISEFSESNDDAIKNAYSYLVSIAKLLLE